MGEAWLTGNECRFTTGEFAEHALGEVWPALPVEWTGTRLQGLPRIPLLVKFIFPADKLSLQVHPDDAYARAHEPAGETGKTEMWYAVTADEGSEVRLGFAPGVTPESFDRAIDAGTADSCLQRIAVRAGDAFFVPAGTVHTIGPGLVLCEVQQHSDLTYRLYDYNRRDAQGRARELHVEKGLDVAHFGRQAGGKIELLPSIRNSCSEETCFLACRHFAVERWDFAEEVCAKSRLEHFDLLIFFEGKGTILWGNANANESANENQSSESGPAQVWMIPAALGEYRLTPSSPTSLLRTYVPPNLDELSARLIHR